MPDTVLSIDPRSQESSTGATGEFVGVVTAASIPSGRRRGMPGSIPAAQRYYWSRLWQQGETETDQDIARGDVVRFADSEAAIRWLLSADDD